MKYQSKYCVNNEYGISKYDVSKKALSKPVKRVNILGSEWKIERRKKSEDKILSEDIVGYCDHSVRTIVIESTEGRTGDCADIVECDRQTLRHEITHAFLFESGLAADSLRTESWASNEEMTDWFAIQSPKIFAAFKECGCL